MPKVPRPTRYVTSMNGVSVYTGGSACTISSRGVGTLVVLVVLVATTPTTLSYTIDVVRVGHVPSVLRYAWNLYTSPATGRDDSGTEIRTVEYSLGDNTTTEVVPMVVLPCLTLQTCKRRTSH